jgi:hypothetical protein
MARLNEAGDLKGATLRPDNASHVRGKLATAQRELGATVEPSSSGRAVPKVVPRRGSVVHREKVEKVPSGFGGG